MMLTQTVVMLVVFVLLLGTSFLLHKFCNKFHYILKFIIKFVVYTFSFICFFTLFKESENIYITFCISILIITYANKYLSLVFKRLDFGLGNDYRIEMWIFLLMILVSSFQGKDLLNLGIDPNLAMNMVWITILVEQILHQLIENSKTNKKLIKEANKN